MITWINQNIGPVLSGARCQFSKRIPLEIIGVDEPTIATVDDSETLYFVYLIRGEDELLDFNVGFVEQKD